MASYKPYRGPYLRAPRQLGCGNSPAGPEMTLYALGVPTAAISRSTVPSRKWEGSHTATSTPAARRVHSQVV